jgi:hypothetical protein
LSRYIYFIPITGEARVEDDYEIDRGAIEDFFLGE